jgi:hypothetical protein
MADVYRIFGNGPRRHFRRKAGPHQSILQRHSAAAACPPGLRA